MTRPQVIFQRLAVNLTHRHFNQHRAKLIVCKVAHTFCRTTVKQDLLQVWVDAVLDRYAGLADFSNDALGVDELVLHRAHEAIPLRNSAIGCPGFVDWLVG